MMKAALILFLSLASALPVSAEGSSIRRSVLPNGLTVIAQTDTASAITVVEILVKGGAAAEPAGRAGLSYLTTRLAMEIPDQETGRDFLVKALRSSMISREDASAIHLEFLTEFADSILGTVTGIVFNPLITNIRSDRLIESMNHQRRLQADDASRQARLAHQEAFFGGTGYAGLTLGTEESLAGLKIKDIKEFYDLHFHPANAVVVVISDLSSEILDPLIARHFEKWKPATGSHPDERPKIVGKEPPYSLRAIEKDQQQSVVSCAFPLPPADPKSYLFASLLENILGRGPGSRLWMLRTEKQLAYNISCLAFPFRQAGFIECYLETEASKTETARNALSSALLEFREKGISAEEFAAGKAVLWADFLRANETKAARATTLGVFETIGLGADFFDKFADILSALTLEETNAGIKQLFDPARGSWVIVGPQGLRLSIKAAR